MTVKERCGGGIKNSGGVAQTQVNHNSLGFGRRGCVEFEHHLQRLALAGAHREWQSKPDTIEVESPVGARPQRWAAADAGPVAEMAVTRALHIA
jgi:hypothetical protein